MRRFTDSDPDTNCDPDADCDADTDTDSDSVAYAFRDSGGAQQPVGDCGFSHSNQLGLV
jgi:hypothetical protein